MLAAAGLLDGRRATTHWAYADRMRARFPEIEVDPAPLYVSDGRIHTSAGTAAGIDLCLALVAADHGVDVATKVARRLVMPLHRPGGQAQYVDRRSSHRRRAWEPCSTGPVSTSATACASTTSPPTRR